jgi:hypothetical protein
MLILLQILATILNRYYNFTNPNSIGYLNWYVGEVTTAVIVTNLPLTWPLIRKVFGLNDWSTDRGVGPIALPPTPQMYSSYTTDASNETGESGCSRLGKVSMMRAYFRQDAGTGRRDVEGY